MKDRTSYNGICQASKDTSIALTESTYNIEA
jgi:hypothetical protein